MFKNKKNLIVESFKKMDCDMLEILLDENFTYQDAKKEVFLEKININFLFYYQKLRHTAI